MNAVDTLMMYIKHSSGFRVWEWKQFSLSILFLPYMAGVCVWPLLLRVIRFLVSWCKKLDHHLMMAQSNFEGRNTNYSFIAFIAFIACFCFPSIHPIQESATQMQFSIRFSKFQYNSRHYNISCSFNTIQYSCNTSQSVSIQYKAVQFNSMQIQFHKNFF